MNGASFPWPDPLLNPNSNSHWRPVAKAKKAARIATRTFIGHPIYAPILTPFILATHYPPDERHRDQDNMKSALKSYLDGIADASGINDRKFRVYHVFPAPREKGSVTFTFYPSHAELLSDFVKAETATITEGRK